MNTFFGCKYPIVCVAMNCVTDVNLSVAIHNSGCMPSLFVESIKDDINLAKIDQELTEYAKRTDNANVIVTVYDDALIYVIDIIKKHNVKFIELLGSHGQRDEALLFNLVRYLQKQNIKVLYKQPAPDYHLIPYLDAVCLKGIEAAGSIASNLVGSLDDVVQTFMRNYTVPVIATGGIATKERIDELLGKGVMAVGIGTLFAASAESKLLPKAKEELIKHNNSEIYGNRRYIKLSDYNEPDDKNMSNSLKQGITGIGGHIYAGAGISEIREVLSVSAIVKRLTDSLYQ